MMRRALLIGGLLVAAWGMAMAFGSGDGAESPEATIVVDQSDATTLQDLVASLAAERVVYVGETHTAYQDHLVQLELLRGLAAQPGELAVGVEWIQARFQPIVDRYLAGEIDESAFLKGVEYFERWRFDYRLYRPIVEFAREAGIPIVALNASRELTREIGRVGIDGLPDDLRAELPDGYDFSDEAYAAALRTMFSMHPTGGGEFQRFHEVQLTWDETMAQNVARYLEGGESRRMIVFAGKGHVSGRSGIPNRVTRRTGLHGVTLATFDPSAKLFDQADFLVLAKAQSLPPAAVMGVMLDERDGAVVVTDFGNDSPAREAGVRKGDRIVAINGRPVDSFVAVKVLLIDEQPGDEIELTVSRDRLFGEAEPATLRFPLAAARG
jgi:uncharacterized iron-regulated protein